MYFDAERAGRIGQIIATAWRGIFIFGVITLTSSAGSASELEIVLSFGGADARIFASDPVSRNELAITRIVLDAA